MFVCVSILSFIWESRTTQGSSASSSLAQQAPGLISSIHTIVVPPQGSPSLTSLSSFLSPFIPRLSFLLFCLSLSFTVFLLFPPCLQSFDVYSIVGTHQKTPPPIQWMSGPPAGLSLFCFAKRVCVTGALKNGWQLHKVLQETAEGLINSSVWGERGLFLTCWNYVLTCPIYADKTCKMIKGIILISTNLINVYLLCVCYILGSFWAFGA